MEGTPVGTEQGTGREAGSGKWRFLSGAVGQEPPLCPSQGNTERHGCPRETWGCRTGVLGFLSPLCALTEGQTLLPHPLSLQERQSCHRPPSAPGWATPCPPAPMSRFKRPRCCHRVRPIAPPPPFARHRSRTGKITRRPSGDSGPGTLGKSPLAKASSSDVFPQPPSPTMTALISVSGAPGLCPPRSRCMGVSGEATEPVWSRRRRGWGQGGGNTRPEQGAAVTRPPGPPAAGLGPRR